MMISALLFVVGASAASAQSPPSSPGTLDASPRPLTVEERLQRLESANESLVDQNRRLVLELEALKKVSSPPVPTAAPPAVDVVAIEALLPAPPVSTKVDERVAKDEKDADGLAIGARFGRGLTNNGLWFQSQDKNFTAHFGGRTQFDTTFFSAGDPVQFGKRGIGKLRDGADFRRSRFRMEGTVYKQMSYTMEIDFVNSSIPTGVPKAGPLTSYANTPAAYIPTPTDLWVNFKDLPVVGNIRIGNQKEPFGFERITSSRFLNFMERSFNQDAFYSRVNNGFVPGIQAFDTAFNKRMTWAAGVFKTVTNPFVYDVGGGDLAVVGRLTGLLVDEDDGRRLVHLGITGRDGATPKSIDRLRVRGPERAGAAGIWPLYADTGLFRAQGEQDVNLEFAAVLGSWTIDAEYDFHFVQQARLPKGPGVGTLFYSGGYVEALYFLTGERRAYNRDTAIYDRIVPRENAFLVRGKDGKGCDSGSGAWQIGARYNYLDLNDKAINGGQLNDFTLGLNWFINPNMKYQWNYSLTGRRSPTGLSDGLIQGLGMRFAMDY